jgi:hypothetical protein
MDDSFRGDRCATCWSALLAAIDKTALTVMEALWTTATNPFARGDWSKLGGSTVVDFVLVFSELVCNNVSFSEL